MAMAAAVSGSGISNPESPYHPIGHPTALDDDGSLAKFAWAKGIIVIRVMLVDDSASFRTAASQFVTEVCGADVIGQADSGEMAIEMALRLRPQVVLMDLAMSGINGIEAGRRIKAADESIRVVILTLNNSQEYRDLVRNYALDGFVSKTDFTAMICSVITDTA